MLEIPESRTISFQTGITLVNKKIAKVFNATSVHKFAWFNDDPKEYGKILEGAQIKTAKGHGMFVDIRCDEDVWITISDGTHIRYYTPDEQRPEKYQLLIVFDDDSCIVFTVAMYGGLWVYKSKFDNSYHQGSLDSISPLDDRFNEEYFENIFRNVEKDISLKALLATEQRIPGLGNGVLQDILFNAGQHPKRKKSALSDFDKTELLYSLKVTLNSMTDKGGRDTEKDLFGLPGGYKSLLSKNTVKDPCPSCGGTIIKEAYMGGAVYFCPACQKL